MNISKNTVTAIVIGGSLFAAGIVLGKKMCDNAVTISVMEPDTAKVELELVKV